MQYKFFHWLYKSMNLAVQMIYSACGFADSPIRSKESLSYDFATINKNITF